MSLSNVRGCPEQIIVYKDWVKTHNIRHSISDIQDLKMYPVWSIEQGKGTCYRHDVPKVSEPWQETAGNCLLSRRSQRDSLSLSSPTSSAAFPSVPPLEHWLPAATDSSNVARQCNLRSHWCVNLQAGRKRWEKLCLELLHLVTGAPLVSGLYCSSMVAVMEFKYQSL